MGIAVSGSGTIPDAGNGGMVEGWNAMPKNPCRWLYRPRQASQFAADRLQFQSLFLQNLCGYTLFFPQHPKQQMFRNDKAVPESLGLFCRIGENAFALEGKRHVYRCRQFRFFSDSLRDCVMNIGPRGLIAGETFGDVSVFA